MQNVETSPDDSLAFGPFRLHKRRRLLLEGDQEVRLGSRAFGLLIALVEHTGEVVSREQLEARVWPRSVVEESSLRVHIAALRRALGDGQGGNRYITSVPGRGYCFVAPLRSLQAAAATATPACARHTSHNLPVRLAPVIGRGGAIDAAKALLLERRFVTVTGPGGMGKTTLALTVAEDLLSAFPDGTWLVELAPIVDPTRLIATVASTLGIPVPAESPLPALSAALAERKCLVVLDNCEHVLEAAATLAENLLKCSSRLSVLATSRERLNADGEWVCRLRSLAVPPDGMQVSAAQALSYAAVQLFVQRAMAACDGFALTDADASAVRDLCRQLDGNPLAIDIAAAHVDRIGVRGLAAGLHKQLQFFARGRRTSVPRHRTLEATLDWSYKLLSEQERSVLRRLAVFRGGFTLESACSVASDAHISSRMVIGCTMTLADKSLLSIDTSGDPIRYRLYETTRTYALDKLEQAEDGSLTFLRHAARMQQLLKQAELEWANGSREEWIATHCRDLADVRAAMEWCFSHEKADLVTGIGIAAGALLPVYELGLLDEHREWIEQALERIHLVSPPQFEIEMRLSAALMFPSGRPARTGRPPPAIVSRMTDLAQQLGRPAYRIAALYSLWGKDFRAGDYAAAMATAQEMSGLAHDSEDSAAVLLSDRLLAQSMHFMGALSGGRAKAQAVLQQPARRMPPLYISPVPYPVAMRIVLARTLWLEGHADQAATAAEECVAEASGHPFALTQALALAACPIALWRGDTGMARRRVDQLMSHSAQHPSAYWQTWGQSYDAVLAARETQAPSVEAVASVHAMERECIGTLAGSAVTADTVARVAHGRVGWCAPEILRAQGQALLTRGAGREAAAEAEAWFGRAISMAQAQGALAWELRAALSLGRLRHSQGRTDEALMLVCATRDRFTEGFATADLLDADRLLRELRA
jgi:predicted ATPase/DNA-binding winged helix-turn-helix (wHTH) protein